jgi:hypothetical protein
MINKHMIESLVRPSFYFSRPIDLNDPFDCRINLDHWLKKAASSATGRTQLNLKSIMDNPGFQAWEQKFNGVGVCSFSLDSMETLLWSHYADQHRGACPLYRIPEPFLLDRKNKIIGVETVTYGDERMTRCLTNVAETTPYNFIDELIKAYLTTKSPSWRYEKEARIVREEPGLLDIPGGFLEQVCFGLHTESADISLVTKLAGAYCGCARFRQMVRDGSNFGFTMNEL